MDLSVERLRDSDVFAAAQLIDRAFWDSVSATLSDEGINTFIQGIQPASIRQRLASGNSGVGRKLFARLLSDIDEKSLTVNASINAVGAYLRYGFQKSGPENQVRGIRYQPMVYQIT